jgi:hypothetical protein
MTTTTINQETEASQAENHGHELGCFERIAEEILEDAEAAGIAYETGAFGEEISGMTVLEQIIERLVSGKAECGCGSWDEEE